MGSLTEAIFKALESGFDYLKRNDDDRFDRVTSRYSLAIFLVLTVLLGSESFFFDPIDCFVPKEFADNWIKYVDNYCWVRNTYYVPDEESLPGTESLRREIPYYQWAPFIIFFMTVLFILPASVWTFALRSSGYDIGCVVKMTRGTESLNGETRDKAHKYIVNQLSRHAKYHKPIGRKRIPVGSRYGRYLTFMYIFTKCLYIAVPAFLFVALGWMIGDGYTNYGMDVLKAISMREHRIENPMFPYITYCDFNIRKLGSNVHSFTTQCLLIVNLFNEFVFLFIWWWLLMLIVVSSCGLCNLLFKTFKRGSGFQFLMAHLVAIGAIDRNNHDDVVALSRFADYLRLDGLFCFRLLAQNVTDVVAADVISAVFTKWKEEQEKIMNVSE